MYLKQSKKDELYLCVTYIQNNQKDKQKWDWSKKGVAY